MHAKADILAAIRRNRPPSVDLPDIAGQWTTYVNRRQQFVEVLEAVGGDVLVGRTHAALDEQLRRLPIYANAQSIAALMPGIGESNIDLSTINSPHALANVDLAILPGEFAVAENAAIWVTDRDLPFRVLYFLCQHLVLVVPASNIVDHMHSAYDLICGRVSPIADSRWRRRGINDAGSDPKESLNSETHQIFTTPVFGAFISGPSKTADIEQSLVIGAHGPRSLTVCLLDEEIPHTPQSTQTPAPD